MKALAPLKRTGTGPRPGPRDMPVLGSLISLEVRPFWLRTLCTRLVECQKSLFSFQMFSLDIHHQKYSCRAIAERGAELLIPNPLFQFRTT